jgi:hypothetical protein
LEAAYPSLAKLHSIGESVQDRNIIVLQVSEYQTLPQLLEEWRGLEAAYPSLAKLHSIGQSVQDRNIIVLQVSEYQTLPQLQEEWWGLEAAYPSLAYPSLASRRSLHSNRELFKNEFSSFLPFSCVGPDPGSGSRIRIR